MELTISREEWRTTGTVEIRHRPQAGLVNWRRAFVYPIAGGPRPGSAEENRAPVWRLSIEKHPEHGDTSQGGFWYGGRVIWNADSADRDAVELLARRWVADGIYPS